MNRIVCDASVGRIAKNKTPNEIGVDRSGMYCYRFLFYMGARYRFVPPDQRKSICRGAVGLIFEFVRDDGCIVSQSASTALPDSVVLKVSRSESFSSIWRECIDTVSMCEDEKCDTLVASTPLNIVCKQTGFRVGKVIKDRQNLYTCFCVMPKYHDNLQRYTQRHDIRNTLKQGGEAEISRLLKTLLHTVIHLYKRGYIYADLKLCNILVSKPADDDPRYLLGDVGGIYSIDTQEKILSTFPPPSQVDHSWEHANVAWPFATLTIEYITAIFALNDLRCHLYQYMVYRIYVDDNDRRLHALRIRDDMAMFEDVIPDDWCVIKHMYAFCLNEDRVRDLSYLEVYNTLLTMILSSSDDSKES